MGRTYGDTRVYDNGVFKGKKAMLSITIGGDAEDYLPTGRNGDLMSILRPIHRGMLQFTGFMVLSPHIIHRPARKSKDELEKELAAFEQRLLSIWEEPALNVGVY
jgi:NAD(P)H dehydrogenase (quinone)